MKTTIAILVAGLILVAAPFANLYRNGFGPPAPTADMLSIKGTERAIMPLAQEARNNGECVDIERQPDGSYWLHSATGCKPSA